MKINEKNVQIHQLIVNKVYLINSTLIFFNKIDQSTGNRSIKRAKLKSSDELSSSTKPKSVDPSNSHIFSQPLPPPQTTTLALPLSCFIHPDPQQQLQQTTMSPSYTIDLNTLKNNGMNIIFTPSTSNSSEPSPPSNIPLVLTLGNFPFQPT